MCSSDLLTLIVNGMAEPLTAYVTGKHESCSLSETLQGREASMRQAARFDYLKSASSVSLRESDGTELWNTPDGPWWAPSASGGAVLYDLAEQDRDIYRSASGVQSGDIVLDCGANVGVFVKKALSRGAARVIAIEPAPENIAVLRKNFAAEIASGKVTIYEKGVWDKDDVLGMHIDPADSARDSFVRQSEGAKELRIPVTTIDHLVAELGLPRVDFIKMDIEGAERHAVAGARQTIQRFRPRMAICVYHLSDDPQVIRAGVASIEQRYRIGTGCLLIPPSVSAEVQHFRPD